jgi:hypothetical protein
MSGSSLESNSSALRIFESRSANDRSSISNDIAAEFAFRCPLQVCRINTTSGDKVLAESTKHNDLNMVLQRNGICLCNNSEWLFVSLWIEAAPVHIQNCDDSTNRICSSTMDQNLDHHDDAELQRLQWMGERRHGLALI